MNPRAALAAVHAAVILFGVAGLFGKWLALPAIAIVLGRTVFAAAALGAWLLARKSPWPALTPRLAANGVILAIHWWSFFAAIQVSTVGIGLLGYASFPLFVLILEGAFLGQRWRGRDVATASMVAAGLALLVPELTLANRVVQGLAWGVLSGFTFALLAVSNRESARRQSASGVAFWQNLAAAAILAPIALLQGPLLPHGPRELALVAALGIVCTALAHTLFIAGLAVVSTHTASIVAALEPVYGMVLAYVLLSETPDARMLAGGVLIVGAAIVVTRRAGTSPPIG